MRQHRLQKFHGEGSNTTYSRGCRTCLAAYTISSLEAGLDIIAPRLGIGIEGIMITKYDVKNVVIK